MSHIGMYDAEVALQAINRHVYMLAADEEVMYRTFDGWFFDTNGVIYVDPEDQADKKVAIETAVSYLSEGKSLLWCPEGIWDLSPNYVILPIHFGSDSPSIHDGNSQSPEPLATRAFAGFFWVSKPG